MSSQGDFNNMGGMVVQMIGQLQRELKVDKLSKVQKRALLGCLVVGVPAGSYLLKNCLSKVRKEQQVLWRAVKGNSQQGSAATSKKQKGATATATKDKSEEKRENMKIVNFLHFQFTKSVMPPTV